MAFDLLLDRPRFVFGGRDSSSEWTSSRRADSTKSTAAMSMDAPASPRRRLADAAAAAPEERRAFTAAASARLFASASRLAASRWRSFSSRSALAFFAAASLAERSAFFRASADLRLRHAEGISSPHLSRSRVPFSRSRSVNLIRPDAISSST